MRHEVCVNVLTRVQFLAVSRLEASLRRDAERLEVELEQHVTAVPNSAVIVGCNDSPLSIWFDQRRQLEGEVDQPMTRRVLDVPHIATEPELGVFKPPTQHPIAALEIGWVLAVMELL